MAHPLAIVALVVTLGGIVPSAVNAAQPYVTDDARILSRGACQFEAGKRVLRGSREEWLLPACNFTGNLELLLGRNEETDAEGTRSAVTVFQGKGLFREIKPDDYGFGWNAGIERRRHPGPDQSRVAGYYGTLVASRAFGDEDFVLHANLGARRDREDSKAAATWAVAGEYNLNDRMALIAEIYDTTRTRRGWQAGVFFSLVPDRVELNVSVGGEARDYSNTRYWTVGLRLATPALFP